MKEFIVKEYETFPYKGAVHEMPELIRCKDCKYWVGYYCINKWWGNGHGNYTPPIKREEGFCDWAERKDHE